MVPGSGSSRDLAPDSTTDWLVSGLRMPCFGADRPLPATRCQPAAPQRPSHFLLTSSDAPVQMGLPWPNTAASNRSPAIFRWLRRFVLGTDRASQANDVHAHIARDQQPPALPEQGHLARAMARRADDFQPAGDRQNVAIGHGPVDRDGLHPLLRPPHEAIGDARHRPGQRGHGAEWATGLREARRARACMWSHPFRAGSPRRCRYDRDGMGEDQVADTPRLRPSSAPAFQTMAALPRRPAAVRASPVPPSSWIVLASPNNAIAFRHRLDDNPLTHNLLTND